MHSIDIAETLRKNTHSRNSLRPFSPNDPLSGENFIFLVFTMAIAWRRPQHMISVN